MWLGVPPPTQAEGPWRVVSLAMLGGLNSGRKRVAKAHASGEDVPPLVAVSNFMISQFWTALTDFCVLGLAPAEWQELDCPFFRWAPTQGWHILRQPRR